MSNNVSTKTFLDHKPVAERTDVLMHPSHAAAVTATRARSYVHCGMSGGAKLQELSGPSDTASCSHQAERVGAKTPKANAAPSGNTRTVFQHLELGHSEIPADANVGDELQ